MLVSHCFPSRQHPRGMEDRLGEMWGLAGKNESGGKGGKGETSTVPGNKLR